MQLSRSIYPFLLAASATMLLVSCQSLLPENYQGEEKVLQTAVPFGFMENGMAPVVSLTHAYAEVGFLSIGITYSESPGGLDYTTFGQEICQPIVRASYPVRLMSSHNSFPSQQ